VTIPRRRAPLLHGLLANAQVRALRERYNQEKAEKIKRQPTNVSFSQLPRAFTNLSLTHAFTSLSQIYRCFYLPGASPCVRRPWLLKPLYSRCCFDFIRATWARTSPSTVASGLARQTRNAPNFRPNDRGRRRQHEPRRLKGRAADGGQPERHRLFGTRGGRPLLVLGAARSLTDVGILPKDFSSSCFFISASCRRASSGQDKPKSFFIGAHGQELSVPRHLTLIKMPRNKRIGSPS
jgi:hypothetical protein